MRKLKNKLKNNKTIYNFLLYVRAILKAIPYRICYFFFHFVPIDQNKIVITNYFEKGFSDNSKYICEELKRKRKKYKIIWICSKKYFSTLPDYIIPVKVGSVKAYFELTTAKIWLDNCRKDFFIKKRSEQVYIQLWHGGIGMKKVEQLAEDDLDSVYIKSAKNDSRMMDYAISNSLYRTNIYKNNFWYNGEILELGCPRNDIFFNCDKSILKVKIANRYNFNCNDNIVLYVPTFRKGYDFDYNSFEFKKMISKLKQKYNNNYLLIVKLHSNVKNYNIRVSENIINASDYPDVSELLMISDIVISDYSSVIFDSLYTSAKLYLYLPDFSDYQKNRGLNLNIMELPFSVSKSSDELIKNILNNDFDNYLNHIEKFKLDMKLVDDGFASNRVTNLIDKIIGGK